MVEFGRHIGLKIRSFLKREGSIPSTPIKESSTNKEKEDMSTTRKTTQAAKLLNTDVETLKKAVSAMGGRISALVDDIHLLKREVAKFKSDVAKDIDTLETTVRGE